MIAVIFCFFGALSGGWAQDTATIVGTVTDSSGAVVPTAKVTVSNSQKGFTRNLTTDSAGEYTAAKIPIGSYVVSAESPGFRRQVLTNISLDVGQTLRVNLTLTVGEQTQSITVEGNVAKVETETGSISDVVTGSQISQLNLNGRNFTNLATLIPGAAPGGYDPSSIGVLASSGISFNGVPTVYNNWEIDGTNNSDQGAGSTANMTYPNIDSLAEFRIVTSNYSAEFGKNAGATIEVATKAGTRQFHGDLFEFVRNDVLDANDWFLNRQIAPPGGKAPKTPLKRNDYGFTIGGPAYIPGHYNTTKSKTFFFWSEDWRQNRQGTVVSAPVPTTLMRQGDFSQCDPASGNYNPVVASGCVLPVNPATQQTYPGDIVPIGASGAALLAGLVPLPNSGVDVYTAAPSLPTHWRQDMIRVDQNIGDKTSIFVRYTQDAYEQTYVPTLWSNSNYDTVKTEWTSPAKSAVIHFTRSLKPNLMNEFIMGFSADVNTVHNVAGPSSPAGSIDKPSGYTVKTIFPANATVPLLPSISIGGGLPWGIAESTGFEYFFWGPITTLKDNLVWTKGKQVIKMGFYVQDSHLNQTTYSSPYAEGSLNFSTSDPKSTGNALADMYIGQIASYGEFGRVISGQLVGGYGLGHWREWDFEPYLQDDWKVTPKLTLNLGVRYVMPTIYHDIRTPTNDSIFIPSQYNPANEAQIDINGYLIPGTGATFLNYGNGLEECGSGQVPAGCVKPSRSGIAPRFGFAWDPTGSAKTVIRGGYGISYDVSNGNEQASGFFGNPPSVASPFGFNIDGYDKIVSGPISPTSMNNVPLQAKWPSVQQFSLGVQHEFPGNNFVSVSYVGSQGRHLGHNRNMNQVPTGGGTENVPALAGTTGCDASGNCDVQNILINNLQPSIYFVPYRGYTGINIREWAGVSSYNSLQANFRHSVGHGLTFQAAYTWSHTIDDQGEGGVNDYDISRWKATSGLNQAQLLVMNYVYQVPFFAHSTNSFLRNGLGGWEISGITNFLTGQPIDFGCGINGLSSGVGGGVRCNSIGKVRIEKGTYDDLQFGPTPTWVNTGTFGQINMDQLPANGEPGMFGYMGRNPLTGPGRNNWDMALLKNFQTPWFNGEHGTIQFRWETFNAFNHPQWNGVSVGCSGATAPGQPCTGPDNLGNGEISSAWPARIMQFGLKFVF
jgi:hypothetical protein